MKRFLAVWMILAVALFIVPGLTGCGGDDNGTKPGINEYDLVTALGDAYFNTFQTPSGQSVNATADAVWNNNFVDDNRADDYYILDWRGATDFAAAHIEGAVNASLSNFDAVMNAIPSGRTVLNVCYTGQTASYVTSIMNMLGTEAQCLRYGMCGWTTEATVTGSRWENGMSNDYASWLSTVTSTSTQTYSPPTLSTGEKDAESILRARADADAAAGWKTIKAVDLYNDIAVSGKADDYFIICYQAEGNYNGGHVPGAVRFQPKQDLASDKLLNTIPTDKKVVVYCYTGHSSAQVVAYLNMLGYNAYSLLFGVNSLCSENSTVCSAPYTPPTNDYPVVP
jgi:rhodanese-related sulfurtransferase